ncbi:MAG TPA: hypothetical protein VJ742_02065 [Nitrososphaera sp.]|nr:hypothetical protein [Nitrososphaera sp.]
MTGLEIDYEFLNSFCQQVVGLNSSIRWAGIVNKNGVIVAQQKRRDLQLLLTEEENEDYASTAIARQKTRGKFESKIGKMHYAFGRYEKLHRATIPVDQSTYLLVTIDVTEKNFDGLLMGQVVPLIEKQRNRFVTMSDSI